MRLNIQWLEGLHLKKKVTDNSKLINTVLLLCAYKLDSYKKKRLFLQTAISLMQRFFHQLENNQAGVLLTKKLDN